MLPFLSSPSESEMTHFHSRSVANGMADGTDVEVPDSASGKTEHVQQGNLQKLHSCRIEVLGQGIHKELAMTLNPVPKEVLEHL